MVDDDSTLAPPRCATHTAAPAITVQHCFPQATKLLFILPLQGVASPTQAMLDNLAAPASAMHRPFAGLMQQPSPSPSRPIDRKRRCLWKRPFRLALATDRAIKTGSPLVDWKSATRFLSDMKMVDSGQNYARLREAFRRLSGFSVTVEHVTETNEKLAILPVFETSNIPRLHPAPKVIPIQGHESAEQEYEQTGIPFGSTFYKEIVRHHVPFPLDVLRSVYRKPQMSDDMMFLHWRVFAAQSETVIPWSMMREQLWQEDSNLYRMRTRFQEVIRAFKVVWPDLTAGARPASLYIAPIRSGKYLIPGSTGATFRTNG